MTETVDRPALDEIEVTFSGVIPEERAFAADKHSRRPRGDLHQGVKRMCGNVHGDLPRFIEESGKTREGRTFEGAAFSKTLLIWLFSVVVGHGATHHRRTSDDGKRRGAGSG